MVAPVAVAIGPGVGDALVVLIRVGVGADAGTGIVPEQSVAGLDHGLAVAGDIVGEADARTDVVPGEEMLLGEHLLGHADRANRKSHLLLLRHPAVIAIPADTH